MTVRFGGLASLGLIICFATHVTLAQAQDYYQQTLDSPPVPLQRSYTGYTNTSVSKERMHDSSPPTALYHFDNEIWVAGGVSNLNYKESVSPIPDSDTGNLANLAGGFSFLTHSNLYLAADGSAAFGRGHYNGALYDPATNIYDIPTQTSTNELILNVDGKIGQGIPVGQSVMFIPYGDLGFRYWKRDLADDQGEDYRNFAGLGGLMFQWVPLDRVLLSLYGAAGSTFGSSVRTSGPKLDLGSAITERVGAKIGFDLTHQWEIFTTVDYDHFHYVQSQPSYEVINNSLYSVTEPSSRTEDTVFRIGLGYHFR